MTRRHTILGRTCSMGLPVPNMTMTTDRPPNTSSAVPTISDASTRHTIASRDFEDVIAPGRHVEIQPA